MKGKKGFPKQKAKSGRGWTALEDEVLRRAHQKHGEEEEKWVKMSEYFNERDYHDCWNRWNHTMKPNIKRQPWSKEEDKKVSIKFASQFLSPLFSDPHLLCKRSTTM